MKTIRVVAAVICDDMKTKNRVFATARGYGKFKGLWEFPGGKIEEGETPKQALVREIREELASEILVGDLIDTVEYDYPDFHLSMDCFWAELVSGSLELKEAEAAKWLTGNTLFSVEWLPADLEFVKKIGEEMEKQDFKFERDRIFLENDKGETIAYVEFPEFDEGKVEVTHTVVSESLRGRGIAGKLIRMMAEKLIKEGRKAELTCSYAIKWFNEHREFEAALIDPEKEYEKVGASCRRHD
ncbi:MAG: GNAT family N-acetyltransferase [Firmicutes bacterium]|nr:GNAT family N-acetyltransferase [Bacillota bacterium]